MSLAATHGDVWETSFCTPEEFRQHDARMRQMLGDRPITRSLEIDGFLSLTQDGLSRLLRRVRAERGPAEDLARLFDCALLGTPGRACERLRQLARAGVDQVVVALHDPHDPDALEALADSAARS